MPPPFSSMCSANLQSSRSSRQKKISSSKRLLPNCHSAGRWASKPLPVLPLSPYCRYRDPRLQKSHRQARKERRPQELLTRFSWCCSYSNSRVYLAVVNLQHGYRGSGIIFIPVFFISTWLRVEEWSSCRSSLFAMKVGAFTSSPICHLFHSVMHWSHGWTTRRRSIPGFHHR